MKYRRKIRRTSVYQFFMLPDDMNCKSRLSVEGTRDGESEEGAQGKALTALTVNQHYTVRTYFLLIYFSLLFGPSRGSQYV